MLLQRSLSEVALGLVSRVIKGMNGLREMLCLLLWHSLPFSQAILHTSQELWACSFIVLRGCFPQETRLCTLLVTSGSSNVPEEPPAPACARWARQFFSWVVSELITFLPHNQLAFPNSQFGDLRHSCPPSARPRSAHFQTNFLRCAKHMQILLHQSCPLPTPQQLLTLQTDFNLI